MTKSSTDFLIAKVLILKTCNLSYAFFLLIDEFPFCMKTKTKPIKLCVCIHTHTHIYMFVYIYIYIFFFSLELAFVQKKVSLGQGFSTLALLTYGAG